MPTRAWVQVDKGLGLTALAKRGSGGDGGFCNQKHDAVVKKANIAALTEVSCAAACEGSYFSPLETDEAAAGKQGSGLGTAL